MSKSADPLDLPALLSAMNESAYSGCASFYPEAGTICTERGRDLALWCDRCLLREAAAALVTLTADRDQQARRADEAERDRDEAREYLGRDLRESRDRCVTLEIECQHLRAERDALRAQLAHAKKRLSDIAWKDDGDQWGR